MKKNNNFFPNKNNLLVPICIKLLLINIKCFGGEKSNYRSLVLNICELFDLFFIL